MAAFSNTEPMYDDFANRSPRSFRHPAMNRQPGRPDGFSTMHGGFGLEQTHGLNSARFGGRPDPFGSNFQQPPAGNMSHFPYDMNAAQTWNSPAPPLSFGTNGMPGIGQNGDLGPARSVKPSRGRVGINNIWYDQLQPPQQPGTPSINAPRGGPGREIDLDDDELIPTAIVIKNIPFAVKKEQLVQLMVDMNLPLPYAFNYHFDNGVFRGLAFANFTSPQETESVINALNHMELSGRKLRVEYKKMLPLVERERIEREKRERRGQLEEQHRPLPQSQLSTQLSLGSMNRNTPSPLSSRSAPKPDVDMNDPRTLELYTEMMIFQRDQSREVLIYPATLEPQERRTVHTLAHNMGLAHTSRGTGDQRQVHIYRVAPGSNVSPPTLSGAFPQEGLRQTLGRSSTGDVANEHRAYEAMPFNNQSILRGQSSVGLLDVDGGYGRGADSNLRNAKSFADLRSWSPSPVPSSASFPAALQTNGARLQQQQQHQQQQQQQGLNDTAGSNTPTLTPTGAPAGGRDEPFLISSMGNMTIGGQAPNNTSPRRQRSLFADWSEGSSNYQSNAPIGSKRTVSMGPDNRESVPIRQSRGPTSNNTIGFGRHQGRGSDELRKAASAIAE
ncbi:uncharacterized protein HMPREF1541_10356 [Cyphellophora europaea CBS 101466]|uniref:RNA-binding protein PIN4 n=1 Tax=Cyphellophora europaea (strain CBS 101466) TaxID=1220924 RepID=W2S7J7_CYPE1|nr:uncharacterized protein HMPREF1541_10356 [Cyphellophora europaea CBS 101466]ETN44686.1 hypothetical protein HMPREF1541_10356 [Cyphellophora europaea CBS 101466]